jgi:hypothetical protein
MKRKDTVTFLHRHFGEDAFIRPLLSGGWRITTRTGGEVVFTGKNFRSFIGGADVYRGAISAGKELWETISVDGPAQHIMVALAHGEEQDAIVQPTIENDSSGCLKAFAVMALYGVLVWIASRYMESPADWVVGLVATGGLWLLVNPAWDEAVRRAARQRGQQYVDAFPKVHAPSDRMANYEEARRKGLL